ncbi:hypothetical protein YUYDRAFT_02087 [Streptomyces sp. ScaeMP-e48]|uniref:hypothetical protein n=1 Tax=Streptomyces sp. ScaeMP-e48 TaxID=1100823 RepID=UPI0008237ED8|nr:hypothetical protein [Streptomyces sp. ScaeMP-e48]SCK20122.1 hypothetical protein YUYDRAFT_02087 [Streptomyces sp. ScaeMP-e48]
MSQKALGRQFNALALADNKWVSLTDADGVAFICYLAAAAGDTYTLTQAQDGAGTGAKALVAITEYHTSTGDGTDAWTRRTQTAAGTVVTAAAATQNAMVVEVEGTQLDDGFSHVRLASTGAGAVTALTRDLNVQRAPENLPAMSS